MIPLSTPFLNGNELKYVSDCIKSGWVSSSGTYVDIFENKIKKYTKSKYAVSTMNGTSGLHTSLILLDINKNDIVLTTNLTFVATLNSIKYTGATPVLFDIDEKTWQIDINLINKWLQKETVFEMLNGKKITIHKKTKKKVSAILPVHVLGGLVDMKKIIEISKIYNIKVIEDSSEALGSYYGGQHSGTFGDLGVFSFNGNKIITTGGGGMIITNNKLFSKRAKHITKTAKVNSIDYFHDEIGYNYRLVNILAGIGIAQMENFEKILDKKKKIDVNYKNELSDIDGLIFQKHYKKTKPNNWLFTFRTQNMRGLLNYVLKNGIESRPFWTPMNELPMFTDCEYITENEISKKIFNECISIPSSASLTESDQMKVIKLIRKFYFK